MHGCQLDLLSMCEGVALAILNAPLGNFQISHQQKEKKTNLIQCSRAIVMNHSNRFLKISDMEEKLLFPFEEAHGIGIKGD